MLRKKVLFIVMVAVLIISLIGCSSNQGNTTDINKGDDQEQKFNISYSTWANDGEPAYEGMEKFKEIVEERTNGNIKVDLFPANQLGATSEQMEQLQLNSIQMVSSGLVGSKKIEYLALPYLMSSFDDWKKVLDSEIGQKWNQELIDEKNIILINFLPRGGRAISSSSKIETPDDMKGLKIRVPEVDYFVDTFIALGANPTPMDFGEVYSALQTGVVNGQENPMETFYSAGFQEVQKYVIETNHIMSPAFVTINGEFFDSLPEDYQKIIMDASTEAYEFALDVMQESINTIKSNIEDAGVEIITPDLTPFIEATQVVRDKYGVEIYGEDVYNEIIELCK